MALEISLIYVNGCEKRNPKQLHKTRPNFRTGNSEIVILDKSSCCRDLVNNFSSLVSWTNLHVFNT